MSDIVLILSALLSLLVLFLLGLVLFRRWNSEEKPAAPRPQPRGIPLNRDDNEMRPGRRQARHRQHNANRRDEEEFDENEDYLADEVAMPDGKVGVKKRKKLEMKAEKRQQRERDLEEREERKQRQQMLDDERKKLDEIRLKEEEKKAEEERLLKEEKEKQELEAYMKLKEGFAVEEEGFEEDEDEDATQNKLQTFIDYIKQQKVVLLEDLAGHFQMKTQDVINRVQDLMTQERLVGVIDDRGKFIYIPMNELEAVAKFINQRGRVSIPELMENSNKLINLQPES